MPTPRYKIRPDTGELQEYLFEYNGILALKNFVARVDGERLILHSAADMNFSILDALVSEVEIDGRVYDNAEAAQEALMRLTFNTNRPVILTQRERELLQGALQRGTYVGTAADLKALIDEKVDKVPGKGLSTNDFTNAYKQKLDTLADYDIELDEATTELKLKKGNNVVKRVSLMFLDDEGTKLLYNRTAKTLELRDKRDNLLTSIPVSHFVSNIPNSIVVQNGKIKLMAGSEVINENTISYNDLANKPSLDFAPAGHRHNWDEIDGKPSMDFAPRSHRHHWDEIDGKPALATEGKIQEEIRKIQVGGRNLMRFTKEMSGTWMQKEFWTLQSDNYNELSIYRSNSDWYGITQRVQLQEGETYTLSLYVRKQGSLTFYLFAGDPRKVGSAQTEVVSTNSEIVNNGAQNTWYRVYVAFRVTQSGFCFARPEKSGTGYIDVCGFKLERGNIPTDWSPAPEDLLVSNNARAISSITLTHAHNNATIFLEGITGVDMTGLEDLDSVSFRKCFTTGHVNFTTTNGKQIIYTGDSRNMQEGGEGSTAVVSVYGNKIYVDIRNV